MRKLVFSLFFMVTGMLMMAGCTTKPVSDANEASKPIENEYVLLIGNNQYAVDGALVAQIPWEDGTVKDLPEEFPFPASRHYEKDQLQLSSFLIDDERGSGEQIYSIMTIKDGKTPRNIGIGDSLEALQNAYPELIYHNAAYSDGRQLAEYTRLYSYVPLDGSNNYINFYLKDQKVSMIKIANSLDEPRNWDDAEPILGQDNLFCEVQSDQPGQSYVKYFYVKDDGKEEVLLDIKNAWPQSVDLDGDGITEIVVQYTEHNRYTNVGIYRMRGDQLEYIDVNQALEDQGYQGLVSSFCERAANEQSQYAYYIQVIGEHEDGSKLEAKYVLKTGQLACVD